MNVPHEPSTSSSLLQRVRQHDPDAWSRFARLYGPLVYAWSRRAGVDAHAAQDVVQDVFRAVLVNVSSFRRDRGSGRFRGWLHTVTRSKIADLARNRGGQPGVGGTDAQRRLQEAADSEPDSESVIDDARLERSLLYRALDLIRVEFEPATWDAFWRAVSGGESVREIAADLRMSQGAVRQAKYRVLRRLRQELDENEEFV